MKNKTGGLKNMTNLSLDKLRKGTGAFISESDFQVIQLEYLDYLEENGLIDAEANDEKFCEIWVEEQENLDTFKQTSDGKIEYYSMDDDTPMTTEEYLNNLDMTSYHWENLCRSYWKIFEDILNTGNVDMKLLANILAERTISHEKIYELQKIKSRIAELVANDNKDLLDDSLKYPCGC